MTIGAGGKEEDGGGGFGGRLEGGRALRDDTDCRGGVMGVGWMGGGALS